MNKYLIAFFVLVLFHATQGFSQSNDTIIIDDIISEINDNSMGGDIQVYQNPSLHVLLDKATRINKKEGLTGYRIQIYSGSGQDARKKSFEVQTEFQEAFEDFDPDLIYSMYQAPFFKLRLGDYRSKNEAVEFYYQVKKYFPSSYIVKSKINFPKLETEE